MFLQAVKERLDDGHYVSVVQGMIKIREEPGKYKIV